MIGRKIAAELFELLGGKTRQTRHVPVKRGARLEAAGRESAQELYGKLLVGQRAGQKREGTGTCPQLVGVYLYAFARNLPVRLLVNQGSSLSRPLLLQHASKETLTIHRHGSRFRPRLSIHIKAGGGAPGPAARLHHTKTIIRAVHSLPRPRLARRMASTARQTHGRRKAREPTR